MVVATTIFQSGGVLVVSSTICRCLLSRRRGSAVGSYSGVTFATDPSLPPRKSVSAGRTAIGRIQVDGYRLIALDDENVVVLVAPSGYRNVERSHPSVIYLCR